MSRITGRNTGPELRLRSLLHRAGCASGFMRRAASRPPRHSTAEIPDGDFRPWLFLAPASRLPERDDAIDAARSSGRRSSTAMSAAMRANQRRA